MSSPDIAVTDKGPSSLFVDWEAAREAYYRDRYWFKSFESLRILSIKQYERELCRLEVELIRRQVNSQSDHKWDDEILRRIRELLRCHGRRPLFFKACKYTHLN